MADSTQELDPLTVKSKTMGKYLVFKTIGKGLLKVKLAYDPSSKTQYAAKVCKQRLKKITLSREASHLREINDLAHPNIIKFVDLVEAQETVPVKASSNIFNRSNNIESKTNHYKSIMVMELAPNGTLFETLYRSGPLEEKLARTYFKQLLSAVTALHSKGFAHRDLKPENLLLNEDFQLKLGDFGLCARFDPFIGDQMDTKVGTEIYASPELYESQTYSGTKVDIFSLGVVLFLLIMGNPPFFKANANDPYYKHIIQGNTEKFWLGFTSKLNRTINEDLKVLINDLIAYNPNSRPTAVAIAEYSWVKDDVYSDLELRGEMKARKFVL